MKHPAKDTAIDPSTLPEKENFQKKEVYQHKQPADSGKPLEKQTANATTDDKLKQADKTSKEEGLNQEKTSGEGTPFEGIENLGR